MIDWNDINLDSGYQRDAKILEPYNFDTLLLEVSCNLKEINKKTVEKQFIESLESKINCAKEVFKANLDEIVRKARQERKG
tara:strand:- start:674 stop:916 length:243 start_codon:yes stop_codon:yes gene_type:complete